MFNRSLNKKGSILGLSEAVFKKKFYNPWLVFFDTNTIRHQIFSLKKHDMILFNTNSNVYIILVGSLAITKVLENTKKITLNLLTTGDTFGHSELVNRNSYYEAEAIDTTHVICVNYTTLIEACRNYSSFNLFFVNHLLTCSTKAYYFIEIISHKSITNRLSSLLLLLAEQNGTECNNGIVLNFTITHQVLAQIIGSNRVSVTRILLELIQTKFISMQKKKILIHNPILLSQQVLNK